MTGNAIVAGGDVAPLTPETGEVMEVSIPLAIAKDEGRHVCREVEPRVIYDKLAGDGVRRGAYAGEELPKDSVTAGRIKLDAEYGGVDVFERVPFEDWM
eukprot:4486694-Pyramimonas_sp.AAC.1